jgi:hypothetical protein
VYIGTRRSILGKISIKESSQKIRIIKRDYYKNKGHEKNNN